MITVMVVEDEPLAAEKLCLFLADFPQIRITGVFHDGLTAMEAIRQQPPDLLLLDIRLPGLSGLDLARLLDSTRIPILFTTAFDEFAVEAFTVNAIGYLLKPYDKARFQSVMFRTIARLTNPGHPVPNLPDRIAIRTRGTIRLVPPADILFIESDHNDSIWMTTSGPNRQRISLAELEKTLPTTVFCRVHKRFIVNTTHIREIESVNPAEFILKMTGGKSIPTGRTWAAAVRKLPGLSPESGS